MTQILDNDKLLPECSVIVGSRNKTSLPYFVKKYLSDGERYVDISDSNGKDIEPMCLNGTRTKTRAYIKIQDGCEMYCTYCAIPHARGKLSSKPIDDIIKEATSLISSGHKELILTGINLCCYGRELRGSTRLIDALEAVCSLEGEYRVRLSSIEPEMLTDSDLERMASLERLCPHFHLSLQSGCDSVLKRMKRHYDTGMYYDEMPSMNDGIIKCLKRIAYINISKLPGEARSNDFVIRQAYSAWKDILFKQIEAYSPNVIIFGGSFRFFKEDMGILKVVDRTIDGKTNIETHIYQNERGLYLIDAYHPAYPYHPGVRINSLIDLVRNNL